MSLIEFIIAVYLVVDQLMEELKTNLDLSPSGRVPWRQRGPQPTLSDSEVLTMELVGEFKRIDTDKGIYEYFRDHWADWFPDLPQLHRTTFLRQAARLRQVKWWMWQRLTEAIPHDEAISIVDSFPVHVCQFARAYRCQSFKGEAAYGYDEMIKQTFYGFRCHLRICWPGVIARAGLAAADLSEVVVVKELLEGAKEEGVALGDRNYWSPDHQPQIKEQTGVELLAPFKKRSSERPEMKWPLWLIQMRRRIETVIGQLVGRYQGKRTWARELAYLLNRVWRKMLSHTVCVWLNVQRGHEPFLQFDSLVTG